MLRGYAANGLIDLKHSAFIFLLTLITMVPPATGQSLPDIKGPFEIRTVTRSIAAGGFPNNLNPFRRTTISKYELLYRGQPVVIDSSEGPAAQFLEAWFLEGATIPAVLLGSQSFFLVTEVDGALRTIELSIGADALATYQWLDGDDGQPGAEQEVSIADHRSESRTLSGGTLLLLNHETVLRIAPLAHFRVRSPIDSPELWDYNVGGEPVRALSPDKTQFVLADAPDDNPAQAALVVIDIATDQGYAVIYDAQALNVATVWDVTPAWIAEHFAWQKASDGKREQLILKR